MLIVLNFNGLITLKREITSLIRYSAHKRFLNFIGQRLAKVIESVYLCERYT